MYILQGIGSSLKMLHMSLDKLDLLLNKKKCSSSQDCQLPRGLFFTPFG